MTDNVSLPEPPSITGSLPSPAVQKKVSAPPSPRVVSLQDAFSGVIEVARTFGHMPSEATLLTEQPIGVVMTMTGNDFNLDNVLDFSIGTQEASDRGRVYVFYRR